MISLWFWAIAGAYLAGSLPFAYMIGKFNGMDLRQHGSKNLGATNVVRVLGKSWGYLCFFLDFAKGFLSVLAVFYVFGQETGKETAAVLAGAAAVAGHIWSIFMRFTGGKGMATGVGVLLALAPVPVIIGVVGWLLIFKVSGYVSLASIIAVALMPLSAILLQLGGVIHLTVPVMILLAALAVLIIFKHRGNLVRLFNGTEHRFTAEKKSDT